MKSNKKNRKIIYSLSILLILVAFFYFLPNFFKKEKKTQALSLFKPFGGKIESYTPNVCPDLTSEVSAATAGTVVLTVDEVKVGEPLSSTVGIVRLYGVAVVPPPVPVILGFGMYKHLNPLGLPNTLTIPLPNTWTLGLSFDLTGSSIMDQFKGVPSKDEAGNPIKDAEGNNKTYDLSSKLKDSSKAANEETGEAGGNCQILTNLIYMIGTGLRPDIPISK